jgi:FkbM family methyltransferase
MLTRWVKKIVSYLPERVQFELKRAHFLRQVRKGTFIPNEPELAEIPKLLRPGDWAIDVGANVGYYTCKLAEAVGPTGRVLSFEPMPGTFELLAANVRAAHAHNVTLFNAAASSSVCVAGMDVPRFTETGLDNYYQAHLSERGAHQVLCLPLDIIPTPRPVRLVKIDAEGHDLQVLKGMEALIRKDRPVLIVEASEKGEISDWLRARGYAVARAPGSSNIVAKPAAHASS